MAETKAATRFELQRALTTTFGDPVYLRDPTAQALLVIDLDGVQRLI